MHGLCATRNSTTVDSYDPHSYLVSKLSGKLTKDVKKNEKVKIQRKLEQTEV